MPIPQAEWIDTPPAFQALKAEWNALAERARPSSVFLRHEWFDAAWAWRQQDSRLRLLRVHDAQRSLGIVPLVLRRETGAGLRPRVLEFLTVPDTQLCDLVCAPEDRSTVVGALITAITAPTAACDLLDLRYLPVSSATLPELAAAAAAQQLKLHQAVTDRNLYIDLDGEWATFYAQRSRRQKKANNLVANRLKRAAQSIELRWLRTDTLTPETLGQTLATVTEISARSWKRATGLSLDRPGPGAFIQRLAAHAHQNDWLSLWLLQLDGAPVAMEFQLSYDGQLHALRADYDQAQSELSPGSYLNWKLLESLFGKGYKRYWMGPGGNAYKRHWTDDAVGLCRARIYARTLVGRTLAWRDLWLRPLAKRLLRRDRPVPGVTPKETE